MPVPVFNEDREIEMRYVGRVINEWERNGYHDSDWFVLVMEDDGTFRSFEYSTTRGGSAPASAKVDATPEVLEAYAAHQARIGRVQLIRRLRAVIGEAAEIGLTPRQWCELRRTFDSSGAYLHTPAFEPSRYDSGAGGLLTWASLDIRHALDALGKLHRDSFRSDFKRSLARQLSDWISTPADQRKYDRPLSDKQMRYLG
jgi:hypothetical protein